MILSRIGPLCMKTNFHTKRFFVLLLKFQLCSTTPAFTICIKKQETPKWFYCAYSGNVLVCSYLVHHYHFYLLLSHSFRGRIVLYETIHKSFYCSIGISKCINVRISRSVQYQPCSWLPGE